MEYKKVYVVSEIVIQPDNFVKHRTAGVFMSLKGAVASVGQDRSDLAVIKDPYQKYWTHQQPDRDSGGIIYLKITEDRI